LRARGEPLTPDPSPTKGEGSDALTPDPSPTRGEGSDALTPDPSPTRGEGRLTPFSLREKGWG